MGTINIVKTMKMIHPSCVIIVKIGNFYHVYGKDAYIFAYLLEYKITEKDGIPHCGFPKKDLEIKRKIKEASYQMLEDIYLANITTNLVIRKEKLEQVIAKVKIIDFLANLSYDKKIINQKIATSICAM